MLLLTGDDFLNHFMHCQFDMFSNVISMFFHIIFSVNKGKPHFWEPVFWQTKMKTWYKCKKVAIK